MTLTKRLERLFIWLSGASSDTLEQCPAWERRKYVAFGATVLVPASFGIIACSYALSTLTDNWRVIVPVALLWACIILAVDRALLSIYRAYQPFGRKISQFFLRLVVAGLMGVTISHPLTLLLFKDTISGEIEKNRRVELGKIQEQFAADVASVDARLKILDGEIATQRDRFNATYQAAFLDADGKPKAPQLTEDEKKLQAERDAKLAAASAGPRENLAQVEAELAKSGEEAKKISSELAHWQAEFEREINGQRSGIRGIGPRAKSIQDDHLAWRRLESKRLGELMEMLSDRKSALVTEIAAAETAVGAAMDEAAAAKAAADEAEASRLQLLKQKVQQEQADSFVEQQNGVRASLTKQIEGLVAQQQSLHEEIAVINRGEAKAVAELRAEPRNDILTQTLALHALFERKSQGGQFALTAYLVLSLLFMLVDTIPLIVKFFAKPGPYDSLVDLDEVRFSSEREGFLASHGRYMKDLAAGQLIHLTREKPLEAALIAGVDRSRVAKQFLESLLDLEASFQKRLAQEKAAGELAPGKASMLQEMADSFYQDLRARMEAFFTKDGASPHERGITA